MTIGITAAPNGARKQKADHGALPITPAEIVQDVIACRDAGAAMVHVHARNKDAQHSLTIDDNLRLIEALTSAVRDSVIIQLTTEAIGRYSPAQQMALIKETCPPAASFALRELVPDESSVARAARFFHWVAEQQILAQHILYDRADVVRYLSLCERGILPKQGRHALLVLGRYHKQLQSYPRDLLPLLCDRFIEDHRWGTCAFGRNEQRCLTTAMLLGADVRVGFENNHVDINGNIAKDNAAQVAALAAQARALDLSVYDASGYRQALL